MRAASLKALIAVMIWGASFVATKVVVRQIDPFALVTLRTAGGALALFALLKIQGRWQGVIRGRLLLDLALLAFIGVALHLSLQAVALTLTTAGNTAWLVSLAPVFIALLAWRFLGESFGARKLAGFATAMAGALLVVLARAGSLDALGLPATAGDGLVLIGAATWAIYSALAKRVTPRASPDVMMVHVMGLGCLMTTPIFLARQGWLALGQLDATGWLAVGYLAILSSAAGYLFWYDALAALDASQVGAFLYIEPLVTVALAALLLDEPIRPLMLLGGAAILLGVWLVTRAGGEGAGRRRARLWPSLALQSRSRRRD